MSEALTPPAQQVIEPPVERASFTTPPGAVLALGFGTTVAMWAVAYACRLPWVMAPGWVLAAAFVLVLTGGGLLAGRWLPAAGPLLGAKLGGLASLLNLLILGSVFRDALQGNAAQAWLWIPGTIALGAALGLVGASIGRSRPAAEPPRNWTAAFARVAACATLLLLAVGGLVTSHQAGLAVPDWPNSYASNMFLYPLSRMTGDIYLEHAHRLFGSLVGLTTLVLAIHVVRHDERPWVRKLVVAAFVFVCLQGLLGGLRVTGSLTLTTDRSLLNPRIELAIVHGITGQLFFALLVSLAAFLSTTWKIHETEQAPAIDPDAAESARSLSTWLVGLVVLQLMLGALVRHVEFSVTWHITVAVLVVLLSGAVGLRAWSSDLPALPRAGASLLAVVGLQFLLGWLALATTARGGVFSAYQGGVTTIHQTVGAVVLACAVLVCLWTRRLIPAPVTKQ